MNIVTSRFNPDMSINDHYHHDSPTTPTTGTSSRSFLSPFSPEEASPHGYSSSSLSVQRSYFHEHTTPLESLDARTARFIGEASHTLLNQLHNGAYAEATHKAQALQRENDSLRAELQVLTLFREDILINIPQLIGMNATSTSTALPSTPMTAAPLASKESKSPPSTEISPGIVPWASLRVTLGFGIPWPTATPRSECPNVSYYAFSEWKKHPLPKAGKRGPHSNEHNVGQRYIEDKDGKAVSGLVAEQARNYRDALLNSLRWSGQATATYGGLSKEAKAYIYANMTERFPMLLFCEDGMWKTDVLFQAGYSQWAKDNGLKNSDGSQGKVKDEPMDVDSNSTQTTIGSKRRLSTSDFPTTGDPSLSSRTKKIKPDSISSSPAVALRSAPQTSISASSLVPSISHVPPPVPLITTAPNRIPSPPPPVSSSSLSNLSLLDNISPVTPRMSNSRLDFDYEDPFVVMESDATPVISLAVASLVLSNLPPSEPANTGIHMPLPSPDAPSNSSSESVMQAESVGQVVCGSRAVSIASSTMSGAHVELMPAAALSISLESTLSPIYVPPSSTPVLSSLPPVPPLSTPVPPSASIVSLENKQPPSTVDTAASHGALSQVAHTVTAQNLVQQIPLPTAFTTVTRPPRQQQTTTPSLITTSTSAPAGPSRPTDGSPSTTDIPSESGPSGGGKRGKTKAEIKLSTKYKPLTLSWQSVYAGRLLEQNPDILVSQYDAALKAISDEERE
ncbi:hypothetical protein OF83DRAFT_1287915, partial [Amylostereum chailletii]